MNTTDWIIAVSAALNAVIVFALTIITRKYVVLTKGILTESHKAREATERQATAAQQNIEFLQRQLEMQAGLGRTTVQGAIKSAIAEINQWRQLPLSELKLGTSFPNPDGLIPTNLSTILERAYRVSSSIGTLVSEGFDSLQLAQNEIERTKNASAAIGTRSYIDRPSDADRYLAEALQKLQKAQDTINSDASRSDEDSSNLETTTTALATNLPLTPSYYGLASESEKDWWDKTISGLQIVGVVLLAVYTCYTIKMYHANKRAADAARDSSDVAAKTMHIDQRAWMNVVVGQAVLQDGSPIKMPLRIVNTGKTPAYNLHGVVVINLLKESEQPDFNFGAGVHPRYSVDGGTAIPNSPTDFAWPILPKFVPKDKPIIPIIANDAIKSGMQNGSLYIVVYARITYDDVFGISHWLQFCSYAHNAVGAPEKATADTCGPYNDVDKNN